MRPTKEKPKETHIQRNYTQTFEYTEEKKILIVDSERTLPMGEKREFEQISLRKLWRLSGRGTALKK